MVGRGGSGGGGRLVQQLQVTRFGPLYLHLSRDGVVEWLGCVSRGGVWKGLGCVSRGGVGRRVGLCVTWCGG